MAVANPMQEQRPSPSNAAQEEAALLEAQLASYARDLQDLFLEFKDLSHASQQTLELFQRRANEVSALNDFLRRRMAELMEVETAYEALLENLDSIVYRLQPTQTREVVQEWLQEGRNNLERLRERRRT